MKEKVKCSECDLLITEYNQTFPPEGREDICEFCYIVSLEDLIKKDEED